MKNKLGALVLASVLSAAAAAAPQIDNSTPIPDARVLLNFGGSGLDWVYAGPIAPEEFSSFNIAPASYRAAEGWRAATAAEWAGPSSFCVERHTHNDRW